MARTPEGKVKDGVRRVLAGPGMPTPLWYYMPVQTGYGVSGIPDLIMCVPVIVTQTMVGRTIGAFVGLETKAPGKLSNLRPSQEHQLRLITMAGGKTFVTDDAAQFRSDMLGWLEHFQ